MLKRVFVRFFREVNLKALLLIITGTIIWSLTMVKSGLVYSYGMGFWGPNGHDGVWHISLSSSLARGSWEMPLFAGETIKNYHIGVDLLLAILHKLTFIPIHNIYFQLLPPLLAFFIGIFCYKFVYLWKKSHSQAFWATFFIYFGGSWGWLVSLIRNGTLGGESIFWSQQSISTLVNPPFALSLLILFAGLWLIVNALNSNNKKYFLLATFIFGLLIQVKVYAGILVCAGLFSAGVWSLIKRRGISILKVFTGVAILSVLLFFPTASETRNSVFFQPFWFLETMMSDTDRFYWPKMASAISNYKLTGNWIKLIPAYGLSLVIFWFGNLGTRIFKEPQFIDHIRNFKKLGSMEVFLYTVIALGVVIPTFFVQRGTAWNTIQFMYYSLMSAGILAGIALGKYIEGTNNKQKFLFIAKRNLLPLFVVVFTVPTTMATLGHYLPNRPPAKISLAELEALNFLSKQPEGVVLTQPFSKVLAEKAANDPPRPLYLYESTAYVSAFSDMPVYLEDEVNLEITGYDWNKRREWVSEFLFTSSEDKAKEFLSDNHISYIYWLKTIRGPIRGDQRVVEEIFQNDEVQILKTR